MQRMTCLHINLIYAQIFFQLVLAKSAQILCIRLVQRHITHTPRGRGRRDHLRVFIKTHSIYMAFTSAQSTASTRIKSEIVY